MAAAPLRCLSLILLFACTGSGEKTAPTDRTEVDPVERVQAPGPYNTGWQEREHVYTDPGTGEERQLRLSLWYPTRDEEGDTIRYQGLFEAPGVLGGAAIEGQDLPVLVYSHGHQGYAEASGRLMAHFASHGWLVVAPDHTGNTTWDGSHRDTAIYFQRSLDISAVLDLVQEGLPEDDPLKGRAGEDVVAMGHSFGGYTVHALAGADYRVPAFCEEDPEHPICVEADAYAGIFEAGLEDARILAHISMAPGDYELFGDEGLAAVGTPILHMTGELDPSGGDNEAIWGALEGREHRRVQILGGGHQTFTDFSGILETFDGLIDPEEGHRIVAAYGLAWAEAALGEPAAWQALEEGEPLSEQAVLMR